MEELLALYALPYDPQYPVICLDERPCFLIGDKVATLAMQMKSDDERWMSRTMA